jgi:hypothetical protein
VSLAAWSRNHVKELQDYERHGSSLISTLLSQILCAFFSLCSAPPAVGLFQNDVGGNRRVGGIISIIPTTISLGSPEATITWTRNGEVINPDDPRVIISEDSGAIVVIDVQSSDRGVYTITAFNIAVPGGVMASVNVFITCKLQMGTDLCLCVCVCVYECQDQPRPPAREWG